MPSYVVISATRNEELTLPLLARALAAQTLLPASWIIVDNGSTDETCAVARGLAERLDWIRILQIPGAATPARGGPVVRAFHAGLGELTGRPDVVVKLDADVTMDADYFERLLREFQDDPRLGMASGCGWILDRGSWRREHIPASHVWGPARAYRWDCLSEVLPLEERMGWDGIDEIKARLAGWTTRTVSDLPFRHHRVLGLREGARWREWILQGRSAHYMGYRPSYVLLRGLYRTRHDRWACAILWGYAEAAFSRASRCPDARVIAYVRRQQRLRSVPARLVDAITGPMRRSPPRLAR